MSSLAASRADNFYFPPDWRPEYGGISKFQGSKGANQYQQYGIIRFELPFDGWCTKCERHISKGTRFNAKKEHDGHYFSTKIWSFHMKCASCDEPIIIKTNPEKKTYDFVQGIRKMEQEFIPEFDDSIIIATTDEERFELANNAIFKLQHDVEDTMKTITVNQRLAAIIDIKDDQFSQDYESNSYLRQLLRSHKKKDNKKLIAGKKYGLNIPLIDSNENDKYTAQIVMKNRDKTNHVSITDHLKKKYQLPLSSSDSIFTTQYHKGNKNSSSSSSSGRHQQPNIRSTSSSSNSGSSRGRNLKVSKEAAAIIPMISNTSNSSSMNESDDTLKRRTKRSRATSSETISESNDSNNNNTNSSNDNNNNNGNSSSSNNNNSSSSNNNTSNNNNNNNSSSNNRDDNKSDKIYHRKRIKTLHVSHSVTPSSLPSSSSSSSASSSQPVSSSSICNSIDNSSDRSRSNSGNINNNDNTSSTSTVNASISSRAIMNQLMSNNAKVHTDVSSSTVFGLLNGYHSDSDLD